MNIDQSNGKLEERVAGPMDGTEAIQNHCLLGLEINQYHGLLGIKKDQIHRIPGV